MASLLSCSHLQKTGVIVGLCPKPARQSPLLCRQGAGLRTPGQSCPLAAPAPEQKQASLLDCLLPGQCPQDVPGHPVQSNREHEKAHSTPGPGVCGVLVPAMGKLRHWAWPMGWRRPRALNCSHGSCRDSDHHGSGRLILGSWLVSERFESQKVGIWLSGRVLA